MDFWSNPIQAAGDWLSGIFVGWGMEADAAHVLTAFIGILLLITVVMALDIFLVWLERKIVARFQDRIGPNRLGPFGLIQPFADIIKLIIKENIYPVGVDKAIFNLAPIIMMMSVLLLWAVLPLTSFLGLDLNVGVLYLIGVGALGTLSIIMAGWASNNKYALLGAFRQVAVMISYEIPMVVALLIPTILAGSMGINSIVAAQSTWYIVLAPLAFVLFLICATAELGRAPFDLTEAESELIAGHHIEYSGMKFGLFYASELLHTFTFGGFIAAFFFGGWRGPWVDQIPLLGLLYFLVKAVIGYWIFGWIKYTFPRIRIDKMMDLNWKFLVPFSFALLVYVALTNALLRETSFYSWGMFLSNILFGWVTLEILRRRARGERVKVETAQKPGF
ncbi:MAG: NADH-quinone oxidoreductase subunit NuoH [Anaerolineae bacterium CFX3]|jgi:NADH-quinone oxidoreductase subunit H|nr:NADH-quinone oxidoreductase subunit H [Anaerolineales bacterium]MCE7904723.1 NADH-quinone oxidoreductase subunit NuoH [Anaerolineae bacterium CFX3]MCQ3945915.1 NADH-quinone oxidoreductase subunit NuoH [Anaerolineae bacterium]OQY80877.1 MAG: NADH-quinone oxidoreductase subunit H [Anaerolineae bacterium UTCFX3]GER81045.1 NADH-quinone oxidoreductase subunit H [Candidatus Denitrolinea symbiosum]